jgi:DNA-binding response OmpR family regulator
VVDAVVRALRKKLGSHGNVVQTVTGFGYRLRAQ